MTAPQRLIDPAAPTANPGDGPRSPDHQPADPDRTTVTLDHPITRGERAITEITLRKPRVKALRGLNLSDLLQMDVGALQTVLPRISDPALTRADLDDLDPADLVQLGTGVASFFIARRFRDEAPGAPS